MAISYIRLATPFRDPGHGSGGHVRPPWDRNLGGVIMAGAQERDHSADANGPAHGRPYNICLERRPAGRPIRARAGYQARTPCLDLVSCGCSAIAQYGRGLLARSMADGCRMPAQRADDASDARSVPGPST